MAWKEGIREEEEGRRADFGTHLEERAVVRLLQALNVLKVFHLNQAFTTWPPPGFMCSRNKHSFIQ